MGFPIKRDFQGQSKTEMFLDINGTLINPAKICQADTSIDEKSSLYQIVIQYDGLPVRYSISFKTFAELKEAYLKIFNYAVI